MPDTRALSVAYAGLTLGGEASSYMLHDPYRLDLTYERATVTFQVCVVGADAEEFADNCDALEDAFRTINGALTLTMNGETLLSYSHSSNTGFLARPSCRKIGDRGDTGYARFYECGVTVTLPADASGKSGLRAATIDVRTEPTGRKAYAIQGQFTALGGNSATAQHAAQLASLQSSVESAVGGTWTRAESRYTYDDENKVLDFAAAGVERIFTDPASLLANSAIKTHSLMLTRMRLAPGDASAATARPLEVQVTLMADIAKSVTQALRTFYESTVRPALVAYARNMTGASIVALVREAPRFDGPANRIEAVADLLVVTGSSLLAHYLETEDDEDEGWRIWRTWDGTPYGAEVFQGKRTWLRRISETRLSLVAGAGEAAGNGASIAPIGDLFRAFGGGAAPGGSILPGGGNLFNLGLQFPGGGGGAGGGIAGQNVVNNDGFLKLRTVTRRSPRVMGVPGYGFSVEETTATTYLQKVTPTARGGGVPGGGAGGGTTLR